MPRGPYDLVVSDVNMPDINGLELLAFIRKNSQHKTTPVLLISTQSSERDRGAPASASGADAFLAKPFTPETLRKEALRMLGQARGAAESNG